MMHQIVILGAGKSTAVLIEFLLENSVENDLFIHVADVHADPINQKLKGHPRSCAHIISMNSSNDLNDVIEKGDLIISMLPPALHFGVAKICLEKKKHFLNASYLTEQIKQLNHDVEKSGLIFLLEMGLDPGIDHMSAMEMISGVQKRKGKILSFASHCGGLVSPESDNNPWHYKISWNPKNVVLSGKDGAEYLENGQNKFIPYSALFNPDQIVQVPGHGNFAWYANRNSIPYLELYNLKNVNHFVRTTLRHPEFIAAWKLLVQWQMTSEQVLFNYPYEHSKDFFQRHMATFGNQYVLDSKLNLMMEYLGMNKEIPIPETYTKPYEILQFLMEMKLALKEHDKDMIVMLHEMKYEIEGKTHLKKSFLVIHGEDQIKTAMAKTVGLPLALAALQILKGNITRKGVFIPIYEDIYIPILQSLKEQGVIFQEFEY